MSKGNILLQLDSDPQPSVFDSVVAIDAGTHQLLRHGNVTVDSVRDLVYGAIFTRGPDDLKHTAIFIGGSDVQVGERLLKEVTKTFFGPFRVSVMLDANGANTTAAAAVLSAQEHISFAGKTALVLAATGPVGRRVVRLLAGSGATVRVGSRQLARSQEVCYELKEKCPEAKLEAVQTFSADEIRTALDGADVVISAGPPGTELVPAEIFAGAKQLKVAIDLNAVAPQGIAGIEIHDRRKMHGNVMCYGAIGVGCGKMKIHRAAVAQLFDSNDKVFDAEEIFKLGRQLMKS